MSPIDVEQKHVKKLVHLVFPNVFKTYKTKRRNNGVRCSRRRNKIKLGDSVHISPRTDIPFRKGYQQRFTDEQFLIKLISKPFDRNQPVSYVLKDKNVEEVLGRFYESG